LPRSDETCLKPLLRPYNHLSAKTGRSSSMVISITFEFSERRRFCCVDSVIAHRINSLPVAQWQSSAFLTRQRQFDPALGHHFGEKIPSKLLYRSIIQSAALRPRESKRALTDRSVPLSSHWCASGTQISTKGRALTTVPPINDAMTQR
jgi:hypothetical protein